MESWRKVWRSFAAVVVREFGEDGRKAGLESLAEALYTDSYDLTQGSTTTPPPLMCVQDWPVEATDAIGWLAWKSGKLPVVWDATRKRETCAVGEVEQGFARLCFECDQLEGEPAACRWFLNFFDDTPRDQMRAQLLAEVRFALGQTGDPLVTGKTWADLYPVPRPVCPF